MAGTEVRLQPIHWNLVKSGVKRLDAAAGGSFALDESSVGTSTAGAAGALGVFYLDSADGRLGAPLKLRMAIATNNVAPGTVVFTVSLRPVTGVNGGAAAVGATLAAAVSGGSITVSSPLANTLSVAVTAPFTPPADGYYTLLVANDAGMAASSSALVRGTLLRAS